MLRADVEAMADPINAPFLARIVPTVDPDSVLGIRNPALRAFAKDLWRTRRAEAEAFMTELPHRYFDENMLHAFLITQEKDFDACLARVEAFLPHVDNWATCDSMNPKALAKNPQELEVAARRWINSEHLYTRRYAIVILMSHFLKDHFREDFLDLVARIKTDEYYLHMAIGWYFAEALGKQPDTTLPWLVEERLAPPVRRKAIQKAIESYRIPDATKDLLRQVRSTIPRGTGAPRPSHAQR